MRLLGVLRRFCSTSQPVEEGVNSTSSVIRCLRNGDFERAINIFCRIPRPMRSQALHESLILACAQVPDSTAAAAVLRSIPKPSLSSIAHVARAYCREQNFAAAVTLVETKSITEGVTLDIRIIEDIARHIRNSTLRRSQGSHHRTFPGAASLLKRLDDLARSCPSGPTSMSMADFFEEEGAAVPVFHDSSVEALPSSTKRPSSRSSDFVLQGDCRPYLNHSKGRDQNNEAGQKRMFITDKDFSVNRLASTVHDGSVLSSSSESSFESKFQRSRGNLQQVERTWWELSSKSAELREVETGTLLAASSAFATCGDLGAQRASRLLLLILDRDFGNFEDRMLELSRSSTKRALLLTTATSTIAASSSANPRMAIEIYCALASLPFSTFRRSMPLGGALLSALSHAKLPLEDILDFVKGLRGNIIQLDEQSFSLALRAILNSSCSEQAKFATAKQWLSVMRSAGVPLTLHTYNALAGQLRYFNDPEMGAALTCEMVQAGVLPSAHTYGLVFSSCFRPRVLGSGSSKSLHSVAALKDMLTAVEDQMLNLGVDHSHFSRLALARAYAGLGYVRPAMTHFKECDAALRRRISEEKKRDVSLTNSSFRNDGMSNDLSLESARGQIQLAYNQMISSFLNCETLSGDVADSIFLLYQEMIETSISPDGRTLELLIKACVRTGNGQLAVEYVREFGERGAMCNESFRLSPGGVGHLLTILAHLSTRSAWEKVEPTLRESVSSEEFITALGLSPSMRSRFEGAVELAVLAYARKGHEGICSRIVELTRYEPAAWRMALRGEDFRRFRSIKSTSRGKSSVGKSWDPAIAQSTSVAFKRNDLSTRHVGMAFALDNNDIGLTD